MHTGKSFLQFWRAGTAALVLLLLMPRALHSVDEPTLEELKGRVANASVVDRPPLCIHIAERQVGAANRFYDAGDIEKAQAALNDVVAFSESARDYAIESHKHEKQSEIAIRKMARKLANLKHTVSREDQDPVQQTIDRLERIRDDLMGAMFPKGGKK
jgi:hypothetical protein